MIAVQQPSSKPVNNLLKMKGAKGVSQEQIEQLSQEFESQFISQLLGTMFNTMDMKDSLGGSDEENQYRSLLIDEYGKIIARTGGVGVAEQVKREMLKLQEVGQP